MPLDGGQVYLVVPGEDDEAGVGADGDGDGVRDGVVDLDELKPEAGELDLLAGLQLAEVRVLDAELLQLAPHEPQGEPRRVNGDVELPEHVREGPYVILVAVGEGHPADLVLVLP